MPDLLPVLLLGGPTASGKSSLAIRIAQELNGVIINADSMQLYDALATLTAQPDPAECAKAPHRLYAVLDPADKTDAVKWRDMAVQEIRQAEADDRLPIIVGGTGFYIETLTAGLSPIPEVSPDTRNRGEALLAEQGLENFYQNLLAADPHVDGLIDAQNPRRVMRAWEVFETTGKSLAYWQQQPKSGPPAGLRFIKAALLPPRADIYTRCDRRFDTMLDSGAVDEVRALQAQIDAGTVPEQALITKAIGFREISSWLKGEISKDAAADAARQATRNYAKRQTTWLRNRYGAEVVFNDAGDPLDCLPL